MSSNEENQPYIPDPFVRQQEQDDFREIDIDLAKEADKQLWFFSLICKLAGVLCLVGWLVFPTIIYTVMGFRSGNSDHCVWFFTFCGGLAGGMCLLQLSKHVKARTGVREIQDKLINLACCGCIPLFGPIVLVPFVIWGTILIHRIEVRKLLRYPVNPYLEVVNSFGQARIDLEAHYRPQQLLESQRELEAEAQSATKLIATLTIGLTLLTLVLLAIIFDPKEHFWKGTDGVIWLRIGAISIVPVLVIGLSWGLLRMESLWLAYILSGVLIVLGFFPILGIFPYVLGMVLLDTLARPETRRAFELKKAHKT